MGIRASALWSAMPTEPSSAVSSVARTGDGCTWISFECAKITAVKNWLFENTNFDCVYSYMNQENIPSSATAAANGMTRIKAYNDGEEALFVYAITREEWNAARRIREN